MEEGNPVTFSCETKNFIDGQLMWNLNWWLLRTTLIRKMDKAWELVERCSRYYALTILHRKKEPISFFGTLVGEKTVTVGGGQVDEESFQFAAGPAVPLQLNPEHEETPEEDIYPSLRILRCLWSMLLICKRQVHWRC